MTGPSLDQIISDAIIVGLGRSLSRVGHVRRRSVGGALSLEMRE